MALPDASALEQVLKSCGPPPPSTAGGKDKKNYTERLSHAYSEVFAAEFRRAGLSEARVPERGRDRQFMGGLGPKGVDVYVADEKHGLLLSAGAKGLLHDVRKNLLNRFRDMVAEALELHMRFPYAVCGHVLFIDAEARALPTASGGTVLQRVVTLLEGASGRRVPADPPQVYEHLALLLLSPADGSVETQPDDVPALLHYTSYFDRMRQTFVQRNPFYKSNRP